MPELPEVETIAQGLRPQILGLRIETLTIKQPLILRGPCRRAWRKAAQRFTHQKITAITRRAKRLIIVTDHKSGLIVQLGMTGKFGITATDAPLQKHTHFFVNFLGDKRLNFIDARRFGKLWLLDHLDGDLNQAMQAGGMTALGPEPFDLTARRFRPLLKGQRPIKSLLLDQTRIAGLGNIYADEALFAAAIHPQTPAGAVTAEQAGKLLRAIKRILKASIESGGTTFSDFQDAYGDMGKFKKLLNVYQRDGDPCRHCRRTIERLIITGRSTHFCPACQEKP